jgi:hypothetical protein
VEENIIQRFSHYLINIEYPQIECSWNISGNLKQSNSFYKFDVRDMFKMSDGQFGKKGGINSKADKMVFEFNDKWIILDIEELHKYIKKSDLKILQLEDLIDKLDWNIILTKKML